MTPSKFAFLLLPLSFAVLSCGTETATERPADSQTHWLSSCDADTDCGDFECLCGVCAQSCTKASDCDGMVADTCVAEDDPAVQTLCREPAEVRLCLTGCEDDDDCSAGQLCESSACVPEDAQGPTPEPEASSTEPNEPNGGAGGDASEPASGGGGDGGASVGGGPSTGNGGAGGEPVANGGASNGEGGAGGEPAANGGASSGEGGAGGDPYSLPLSDGAVVPGEAYTRCDTQDECIIVEPLCSQCCGQVAINASTFEQYQENYVLACADHQGGVCDCQAPEAEAHCVEGQCVVSFPGAEPAQLCENTGGTWKMDCGDYRCGVMPACNAVLPGCDCGPSSNFDQQLGCVEDPACDSSSEDEEALCVDSGGTWDEGSCGHYDCGQVPGCQAVIPGCDCGVEQNFEAGLGCVEALACANPTARAACEDTGGVWDPNSCGDYNCGLPPDCDAIIPGCNCGAGMNFSDDDGGCISAPSCDAG